MTLQQALKIAGVPEARHAEALASVALAKQRSSGLTLAKWSVLPGKAQSMEPKRWEAVRDDGDGKTYTRWAGTAPA